MRMVMPRITGSGVNEHEWECDWLSAVLPSYFPPPTSCSVTVGRVMVLVGICSCGGTDSGAYASPPSYPAYLLSLNVVNECCMKSLRPASCWKLT